MVNNEIDAISSISQVVAFEDVQPGDHCLVVFSQILEIDDGTMVGNEGMIGTYEASVSVAESSSSITPCTPGGLQPVDGSFVPLPTTSCGGIPNGITSDPTTERKLPEEELMVLVPTCPQDLVAVILINGEVRPEQTRLVAGQEKPGYFAYIMPRVAGLWRVATVPVEQFRGTVPDESAYWDVVISPPREF